MNGGAVAAWVVAAGAVWAAGYFIACWWWPYTDCRKCKGAGKFRSPSGRAWRPCRRCKGSGSRVRTGRRIWDGAVKVKDKAIG